MWTAHRKELEVAIHKEKGKDHAESAPDLLSQEDRLRRRLSKLNMDMSVCRGDGNCLRAVCDVYGIIINVVTSDQLNWRKDSLRALRPSLSLTRKSIIQAAIDKADQALQEMASIPEGPTIVEQRISANAQSQSQPATPGGRSPRMPLLLLAQLLS
ncbi:hypothetical protein COCSUDRAFT_44530 [Coccomyxa subellipsoidea C-169]|uniref:Uncharacterized protein n=1 Tax=Coccomyxa subellipsoidea (strain C-169) TaxID=574566 RepID=I0YMT0_COCSC|nr:hypothetical protein COCSUDRAFT_44530 [Coccomyxa subellipsoidea C-169]EIE19699.1 hypothetical protein COCSUDRAFT_44530 [Coccomyxa subellipsoidea C-169]|eukprot:XP_005644243.1 hypothetical protein COCSUDRAFT_44530 [Coccomyxa subellipsoidea C-169]